MTKKLTFCSLMAVFGILSLALSNILQSNTVSLYLLSTMFTYICVEEYGIKYGFLTYIIITIAGFMLVTNKVSIGAYALVIGYYPVIKHIVEHFNINNILKRVIKIMFILIISSISYVLMKHILTINLPIGVIFALGIAIFVVYDIVLTMGIKFYVLRIRKLK